MTKTQTAKKPAAKQPAAKRKPNSAFMKPMQPDAALSAVLGSNKPCSRPDVVSKMWAYIRKNGLQDNKNRRMINTDEKMKAVCGNKKQISMFELNKYISEHLS